MRASTDSCEEGTIDDGYIKIKFEPIGLGRAQVVEDLRVMDCQAYEWVSKDLLISLEMGIVKDFKDVFVLGSKNLASILRSP